MSTTKIPHTTARLLWARSGGRCQYLGCNRVLWREALTKKIHNISYIAHIYGDQRNGPRWDAVFSPRLKKDLSNLMLLCDAHHRLVDKTDVPGHPAARLLEMKRVQERRIEIMTSIAPELGSDILLYAANIGSHNALVDFMSAANAMAPDRYPAHPDAISIGLKNSLSSDRDATYWAQEAEQLHRAIEPHRHGRLASTEHLSIFALAPQPLLALLGSLLSDIKAADVFQRHKEPTASWKWEPDSVDTHLTFQILRPEAAPTTSKVALLLEVSSPINRSRIASVLGDDVAIWSIRSSSPHNDCIRTRAHLSQFRYQCRLVLRDINTTHPGLKLLNVFPAAPVSACVELGRVHQAKADVPLRIWDEQRSMGGFIQTLTIPYKHEAE